MTDKPKRKMSENSLKNLQPFTQGSDKSREAQKESVKARLRNSAEKVKLEDSPIFIWDLLFDTAEKFQKWFATLPPKEQKDVLLAILPKAKQTNEIIGSLGLEKVFITKEETKDTDNHIDDFINDES